MGMAGHMLGEKKLRRLAERSGLPLDRACSRNGYCEGRAAIDGRCHHWELDPVTGEVLCEIAQPLHWSSCIASAPRWGGDYRP